MVETVRVQYVILDVVDFTRERSVEAQSDVVATLNDIVKRALNVAAVDLESTVLLPTGDGIAIALLSVTGFDVHLRLALGILQLLAQHNAVITDRMRQFEVRIGINENIDNVLPDVNGRRNVAGAGISMAQRIMDVADGGQVLVGHGVYDVLRQRETYLSSFRAFTAKGKHGITFPVYQFVSNSAQGLNVSTPSSFIVKKVEAIRLTKFAAYYIAHAAMNRAFLISKKSDSMRYSAPVVLLSFLAEDSVEASETPEHDEPSTKTWRAGVATFAEQYAYYASMEFWTVTELSSLLEDKHLAHYSSHFEVSDYVRAYALVRASGLEKLRAEWPQIANEFGLSQDVQS